VYTVLFLLIFINYVCIFYIMYFMHDCLMHKNILKFTLEFTFYPYFGECYIFFTKYDLCVYSLMMAKCIRLF